MTSSLRGLRLAIVATAFSVCALIVPAARADVSSVEILERHVIDEGRSFGSVGPYEEIVGRLTIAVDPDSPVNQVIIGIDKAARSDEGLVEATGDLRILTPADPARGNGVVLFEVPNRGRAFAFDFNQGGSGPYGDGFLMQEGYTIVWMGWEFDLSEDRGLRLEVPSVDGVPVGGLGFAAVRDAASWVKYGPDAPVNAQHLLSFGHSQSGRFLRAYLYLGFNTDESGRQVFDGVMPNVAGASQINLNRPGAEPVSLGMFDATVFPFADAALRDPVTGAVDGTLGNERSRVNQPLVMYTNTGVEYWGGGRVAALVHSTPDGMADIALPDNVRFYFQAGTQHSPGRFPPPAADRGQEMGNPTDYWWTLRALLTALKDWVVDGVEPPSSRHPRLADGNLVPPSAVEFPAIPGVHSPHALTGGARVANPWLEGDGGEGTALPILVPQVDADGNETSGIVHPEVAVPLATYTGWNFTNPERGDPDTLVPLAGSYIPFPVSKDKRMATGDPRLSIAERYTSRDDYLARVEEAGRALIAERFLREEDLAAILERAAQHWDLLMGS